MAVHSCDSQGVTRYIEDGVVQFDRAAAVIVPGWSTRIGKVSHVKTADETTGRITSTHK